MASRGTHLIKFIRYWLPTLFMAGVIFKLSSIPGSEIHLLQIPYMDKIGHIGIYGLLGFSICRALTSQIRNNPQLVSYRYAIWTTILLCTAYGITDEYHQSFTPQRSVEALDVLADMFGGTLGAFTTLLYRRVVMAFENR